MLIRIKNVVAVHIQLYALKIYFYSNLLQVLGNEIGLKFRGELISPALCTGTALASFHSAGIWQSLINFL